MKQIIIDVDARYEMVPVLARKLLDVPFRLYGRDPNVGIDCVGVTAIAATQAGFDCPNMLFSTPDASGQRMSMRDAVLRDMVPVDLNNIRVGDLLWFRLFWIQEDMGHLAIVSGTNPITMIHTSPLTIGATMEQQLTDPMPVHGPYQKILGTWDRWLTGAYRFRNVNVELTPEETGAKILLKSKLYGKSITVHHLK